MKIAILGASGVIGTWLTEKLLRNNISPRIIVRQSPGIRLARYGNLDLFKVNFNSLSAVTQSLESCDAVVNCLIDKDAKQGEKKLIQSNVNIALNIIKACRKNKIEKIIHLSSIAVLPPCITQEVINNPFKYSEEKDWYTRVKIETEKIFRDSFDYVKTIILRPAIVYGPQIPWSRLALAQPMDATRILPKGDNNRCFAIHVDDLSRLICKLIYDKSNLPPLIYGVNSEKITWSDFYNAHAEKAGLKILIRWLPPSLIKRHIDQIEKGTFLRDLMAWLTSTPFNRYLGKNKFILDFGLKFKKRINLIPKPEGVKNQELEEKSFLWPSKFELKLYLSDGQFAPENIGESLGFKYEINLNKGCENVAQWWNFNLNNLYKHEIHEIYNISRFIMQNASE